MTEHELAEYQKIKDRIDELEEEIYALFDATGKKITPASHLISIISRTKKCEYEHRCEIRLTPEDIRILQDVRQRELKALREIIEKD